MSVEQAVEAESLSYATPDRRGGGVAGVGFALMFGGLGLIFLGGCFLIGVLILNNVSTVNGKAFTSGELLLMTVLYVASFGCFGGAAYLITLAVRHMLGRGR